MKIAHSLEGDLLQQKQKNKELEEYLDVLLLRVMETHPKILQNPYGQRTSLKQRQVAVWFVSELSLIYFYFLHSG
jgi:FIP domain